MRAIGFCHLLLQSRAPVSRSFSTRALPHACGQLRFPHSLSVRRRTSEHPAVSRRQSDCGGCRWRSPSIIEPLSCLSRLSDVPACGSLRSGPHIEAAPRALCDAVREDLAVLRSGTTSIERFISSAYVLRRLPRTTGKWSQCHEPVRLSLVLPPTCRPLRLFTATIPRCFRKRGGRG